MGTDKSEPRIGVIVFVGVFVVATLLSVRAGLVAYFDIESRAEELRKVSLSRPAARLSIQADESRRMMSGPLPIDRAMRMLAMKGRLKASAEIQPVASKDLSPLMGWMQMPATVPGPMAVDIDASVDASPAAVGVDGGRDADDSKARTRGMDGGLLPARGAP
ncbi:MAG: hypothetical protein ABTD50_02165 [Polyangiaceae bacterium]|jgi:hypothetical protein